MFNTTDTFDSTKVTASNQPADTSEGTVTTDATDRAAHKPFTTVSGGNKDNGTTYLNSEQFAARRVKQFGKTKGPVGTPHYRLTLGEIKINCQ